MFLHAHLAMQQLFVFWCIPGVLMEQTRLVVHTNTLSISLASQKRENKKGARVHLSENVQLGVSPGCAKTATTAAATASHLFWPFVFCLAEMTDIIICDVH